MDHTNLSSPAMEDTAPAQARFGAGSDVISARLQQALALLFPSNLAAKAVLFAVVVALLQLLPMGQTPRMWELPHILLLGLVISYGVFGQRNADDEVAVPVAAASKVVDDDESVESYVSKILQGPLVFEGSVGQDSNGGGKDGGVQAWSSQYYADDPLVVVANAGDASEKPLLLPVRKLKPAAEEPATGNVTDDGADEETEFVPKEGVGYGAAREYATSSPSSVLDAGMTLSPCSPPAPPPPSELLGSGRRLAKAKARSFNEYRVGDLKMSGRAGIRSGGGNRFRSNSSIQASRRSTFAGYDPVVQSDNQVDADDELDDMAAASDSSFSSDDMVRDGGDDEDNCELEELEQESSCDEELFELAARPQPEAAAEEDEVDKKADEFIAKFREQIRMQRAQQGKR
ncbi:uncharacterized protein LOC124677119 [Lolium rigidum]|uniref:uncharacterized protein LOC124677119 n=1 Tax=Lolium rigidum TaxID=89674 RepID=UPI001F5D5069|nr:uncharacterized protein LOC124677119 [Lolium rigidum]